jgi:hypothetical protein
MSHRDLSFFKTKKISAGNRPKDAAGRTADFRADSYSSFVDSLLEAFRPPLPRVMQNNGHFILSPLKKRAPAGQHVNNNLQDACLFMSFIIIKDGRDFSSLTVLEMTNSK